MVMGAVGMGRSEDPGQFVPPYKPGKGGGLW